MGCCFRTQPSVDERSPLRQHPTHPHVVRSFTLPNRIHPGNGVDHAQNPSPSCTKIRRNFSKRIATEMKSSDQTNQPVFSTRSSLIPVPRSSMKRDIRRVFSATAPAVKAREDSSVAFVPEEQGPASPTWATMMLKHGYLHKKKVCESRGKKTKGEKWMTVFAVLQNKQLSFFKDHKEHQDQTSNGKLGTVRLDQAVAEMLDSKDKKKGNVIQVESNGGELIHLYADSQQETDHWFTLIQRCVPQTGVKMTNFPELSESSGKMSVSRKASNQSASSLQNEEEDNSDKSYQIRSRLKRFLTKRPKPEQLKTGIVRYSVFGGSLQELVETDGSLVPKFILYFINHIEQNGLDVVGLYRLSGNAAMVQKLRFLVEKNDYRVLHRPEWSDINIITSCLKLYFRELEEPLIPPRHYSAMTDVLKPSLERSTRVTRFREEICQLPEPNYETLKTLLKHLAKVASCSSANMMQPGNLGIVFGPTLLRVEAGLLTMASLLPTHGTVVELLIMYQDEIFVK